jgi:hypothetical protein
MAACSELIGLVSGCSLGEWSRCSRESRCSACSAGILRGSAWCSVVGYVRSEVWTEPPMHSGGSMRTGQNARRATPMIRAFYSAKTKQESHGYGCYAVAATNDRPVKVRNVRGHGEDD